MKSHKAEFEEELEQLEIDLQANTDTRLREIIEDVIEQTRKIIEIIRRVIPD